MTRVSTLLGLMLALGLGTTGCGDSDDENNEGDQSAAGSDASSATDDDHSGHTAGDAHDDDGATDSDAADGSDDADDSDEGDNDTPVAGAMEEGSSDEADADDADDADDSADDADMADDAEVDDSATTDLQSLNIEFSAMVGEMAFACGSTFDNMGTTGVSVMPRDFRFYVQDVRLVTADGTEVPMTLDQESPWQHKNVALLDFEDGSGTCQNGTEQMNFEVSGSVPEGEYVGMAFEVGVPEELNHQLVSDAETPLNVEALFWMWASGYKFARLDFAVVPEEGAMATMPPAYNFHLGSTVCTGENAEAVCAHSNRVQVSFDEFDPAVDKVVLDYAALVETSDLTVNVDKPGCMSFPGDDDCAPMFVQLGIDYESGEYMAETQKIFTKAAK